MKQIFCGAGFVITNLIGGGDRLTRDQAKDKVVGLCFELFGMWLKSPDRPERWDRIQNQIFSLLENCDRVRYRNEMKKLFAEGGGNEVKRGGKNRGGYRDGGGSTRKRAGDAKDQG